MDILNWIAALLLLTYAIGMGWGVNLKKWYGWVQLFLGFILGTFVGLSQGWGESILFGTFFAVLLFLFGPLMWKRRHF